MERRGEEALGRPSTVLAWREAIVRFSWEALKRWLRRPRLVERDRRNWRLQNLPKGGLPSCHAPMLKPRRNAFEPQSLGEPFKLLEGGVLRGVRGRHLAIVFKSRQPPSPSSPPQKLPSSEACNSAAAWSFATSLGAFDAPLNRLSPAKDRVLIQKVARILWAFEVRSYNGH